MTNEDFKTKCEAVSYKKQDYTKKKIIDLEDVFILNQFLCEDHEAKTKDQQNQINTLMQKIQEQKEVIVELKGRSCESCEYFESKDIDKNGFSKCQLGVETGYKSSVCKSFNCNDWTKKND